MRRCRGRRHRLFGDEADLGRGGSDQEVYYGMHVLAVANDQGTIAGCLVLVAWCWLPGAGCLVGPAATSEYWLAEALLRWRHDPAAPAPTPEALDLHLGPPHLTSGRRIGPTGPLGPRLAAGSPTTLPIHADLGFAGAAWRHHWRTTGTPPMAPQP